MATSNRPSKKTVPAKSEMLPLEKVARPGRLGGLYMPREKIKDEKAIGSCANDAKKITYKRK